MPKADHGRASRVLASTLIARHPDEAASLMESATNSEIVSVLEREPARGAVSLLERLSPQKAADAIIGLSDSRTSQVLALLDPHRASALLARMDQPTREKNLTVVNEATADELRQMAEYPQETVGSFMDPRVTAFRPETKVKDVIQGLRTAGRRNVQDVFLVDSDGRLVGSVPLEGVVVASRDSRLEELASASTPTAQATWGRQAVVEELALHRVGSLPVVDFDGRLLGVLRQAELMRTAQHQEAGSMLSMVGASREERALSSPFFVVKKRLPWLQVNLLTAFLAASVVGVFEGTIARFTALAVLLPVVAGQSGNTGAQALAVTMRGLALREIRLSRWPRVAGKEFVAGLVNGIAVAATTSLGVYLWSRSAGLAFVIAISMVMSMTIAGLSGALVPIVLSAIGQDPAQSSSIVLTTVTDVAGFLSFLGIATLLSGIL